MNVRPMGGESLDQFMRRTAAAGCPASLRRYAWFLDISTDEAVEHVERAVAEYRGTRSVPLSGARESSRPATAPAPPVGGEPQ